jgi:DNA repair protein RadC
MSTDKLFGPEEVTATKPKTIKLKTIKAVYETIRIEEGIGSYLSSKIPYTSPTQVFDTFAFLKDETKEYFIALHMDGKNRILAVDICSVGSLNQSIVHPREVYKTALLSPAAAIILIHNHPSGDPTPSTEDLEVTRRLRDAGDLVGIKVLDHIVIGDSYYSFTERGII